MSIPDDRLSLPFMDHLTTKVAIVAVVLLFTLAAATIFLIETGFRRNLYRAYSSSQSVHETQARCFGSVVWFIEARLREDGLPLTKLSVDLPQLQTRSEESFSQLTKRETGSQQPEEFPGADHP